MNKLNTLLILILSGVLLGALYIQFVEQEEPCPLCLLQRTCMLGVAIGALLNIRFGSHGTHFGIILISSIIGGGIALRQIFLHVCPQFPTFGVPVLGLSLYTWSFLVFVCSILYTALLLFLFREEEETPLSGIDKFAFWLLFLIAFTNAIATLFQCGLGPCVE